MSMWQIWEVVMLILLVEGIYNLRSWDTFRCHDILTGFQAIIRFGTKNVDGCNVGIIDGLLI